MVEPLARIEIAVIASIVSMLLQPEVYPAKFIRRIR
jgi:hypothetical protein